LGCILTKMGILNSEKKMKGRPRGGESIRARQQYKRKLDYNPNIGTSPRHKVKRTTKREEKRKEWRRRRERKGEKKSVRVAITGKNPKTQGVKRQTYKEGRAV